MPSVCVRTCVCVRVCVCQHQFMSRPSSEFMHNHRLYCFCKPGIACMADVHIHLVRDQGLAPAAESVCPSLQPAPL